MIPGIWGTLQIGLTSLLLLVGVADDLRSRKVHNQIVVVSFTIGLAFILVSQGWAGLMGASLSFCTAAVAVLPLYLMRILGGGDVKLLVAVSVLMSWQTVLLTLFGSLIWGSILGILQVVLKGEGRVFAMNMLALTQKAKRKEIQLHKIPFTVALFFGFLSSLVWPGGL